VLVEAGAGEGSSFPDDAYRAVGATLASVDEVWGEADLLLKVKEPLPSEYPLLREGSCSSPTCTWRRARA
jgi:alanine dehydrogenase